MIHPIYTELTECRDCYKCVRGCPVKAIQVKDGSAVVVKDRCIYCGHCVDICLPMQKNSQRPRKVRQFLPVTKGYCSLAPLLRLSFLMAWCLSPGLAQLGFSGVSETALGAALVNEAIESYAQEHGDV